MAGVVVAVLGGAGIMLLLVVALGVHRHSPAGPPRKPDGGRDEPTWWPEFESEFRSYAERNAALGG